MYWIFGDKNRVNPVDLVSFICQPYLTDGVHPPCGLYRKFYPATGMRERNFLRLELFPHPWNNVVLENFRIKGRRIWFLRK
jgi:hypothetical protein